MPIYDVRLKQVDRLLVASVREIVPLGTDLGRSYQKIVDYLNQQHIHYSHPAMRLLYSHYQWYENEMGIDVETAIPLSTVLPANEQISSRTLPGGLMAYTLHTGADVALGQAHAALHLWLQENQYRIIGPPRQLQLQRAEHMDLSEYVTEVQFPVEKQ